MKVTAGFLVLLGCLLTANAMPAVVEKAAPLKLTILHTNDIHAHFDQFNKYGNDCNDADVAANKCYGGVSRIAHLVNKIRGERENVLLVDAGII